ncbi:type II secretion system protein [Rugamonas sp. CCM 8940]|uniref:type II secretion system protein n=1 Tax=Rugamonas sp. CCM 8940 TaxID=2765359 RepID=UPI0018F4AFB9|nr:type II secretion system protein [Rugamonas sp. CCM 8940]MBJ7313600.1 type II secretion system protein [Rugamonas sp. CCM 8940]
MKTQQSGFTLVEIAIVLVIVGLIIGGLVTPLAAQLEQRKVSETQRALDEAKEALYGFALRNGYLPCPAVSASNGLEDRSGANCSDDKRLGYLPWATLGLAKLDAWNHLYRYSVSPAFSSSSPVFTLRSARDITVATRDGSGALAPATGVNDTVAVLLSHGRNGYGATSEQNTVLADRSANNPDEKTNLGGDGRQYIARSSNDNLNAPGGEFDDIVVWISPNILYNRMVAAQRLP